MSHPVRYHYHQSVIIASSISSSSIRYHCKFAIIIVNPYIIIIIIASSISSHPYVRQTQEGSGSQDPARPYVTPILTHMILNMYKGCFSRIYIWSPSIEVDNTWKPVKATSIRKAPDRKTLPGGWVARPGSPRVERQLP